MKKILLGIFINAILWIGHAAHAGPVLSLDRALQLAESRSRQLTAQDAAATASRDMALAAGQLPDPTLKFGVNNLPINGEDRFSLTQDFMTMRSIGVMQELTRDNKLKPDELAGGTFTLTNTRLVGAAANRTKAGAEVIQVMHEREAAAA